MSRSQVAVLVAMCLVLQTVAGNQIVRTAFYDPHYREGWDSILSKYLNDVVGQHFNPPVNFTTMAVGYEGEPSFEDVIMTENGPAVDFLFAPAAQTACFQAIYDIAPLATFLPADRPTREIGVIVVRADSNITSLDHIRNATVSALSFFDLTGFVLQSLLLHEYGVHLIYEARQIRFYHEDNVHQILDDVLSGSTDVGFVAGYQLAQYAGQAGLRVLAKAAGDDDMGMHMPGIPDAALSSLPGTDAELEEAVMRALLDLTPGHPAWAEIPAKGFEPPTSYMGVRNMMEHEGIIFIDGALDTEGAIGLAGGWQCRDRHELYAYIHCPADHAKTKEADMVQGCLDLDLSCPAEAMNCVCQPCIPLPEVRLFVLSSMAGEEKHECFRSQVCGTTEQLRPIEFEMTGVSTKDWHRVTYRMNSHDVETGEEYQLTVEARPQRPGVFRFEMDSPFIGRLLLDVLLDDEQVDMSPVYVQVVPRDCNATETFRTPNNVGECVCDEAYMEVLRTCVRRSTFFMTCLVPLGVMLAFSAGFYMHLRIKAADAMWIVDINDLKFSDPPEVLGFGAHGEVLKAVYMGSEVAVKHAIKRNQGKGSKETQTFAGSSGHGYTSATRRTPNLRSGLGSEGFYGMVSAGMNPLAPIQGNPFERKSLMAGFSGSPTTTRGSLENSNMRRSINLGSGGTDMTGTALSNKVNQLLNRALVGGNVSPDTAVAEQLRGELRAASRAAQAADKEGGERRDSNRRDSDSHRSTLSHRDSRTVSSPHINGSMSHKSRGNSPTRSPRGSVQKPRSPRTSVSQQPSSDSAGKRSPHIRAVIRRRSLIQQTADALLATQTASGGTKMNGFDSNGSKNNGDTAAIQNLIARERSLPLPQRPLAMNGNGNAFASEGSMPKPNSAAALWGKDNAGDDDERESCHLGEMIVPVAKLNNLKTGPEDGGERGQPEHEILVVDETREEARESVQLPGQVEQETEEEVRISVKRVLREAEGKEEREEREEREGKKEREEEEEEEKEKEEQREAERARTKLNARQKRDSADMSDNEERSLGASTPSDLSPPVARAKPGPRSPGPMSPMPQLEEEPDADTRSCGETRLEAREQRTRNRLSPREAEQAERKPGGGGVVERWCGLRFARMVGAAARGARLRESGSSMSNALTSMLFNNWAARSVFVAEMRLLSRLRHPCITTVMGAVMHRRDPMLVMEFMLYGSLHDLCKSETIPFDGGLVHPILLDLCSGILFLHSSKPPIIHTDIKAANVLVDERFRAKIADFGLSLSRSRFAGTPLWMAPELLEGGHATPASDVYALGITLNEVLSRKTPYEDEDARMVLQVVRDPLIFYRPRIPDKAPPEIIKVIKRCWSHNVHQRPTVETIRKVVAKMSETEFDKCYPQMNMGLDLGLSNAGGGDLLRQMFPPHVAEALMKGEKPPEDRRDCATVFFCDIVGFTTISSGLETSEVSDMLDRLFRKFDANAKHHGVYKLETIGDCYIGVTNLVEDQATTHAVRMATFSIDAIASAKATQINPNKPEMGHVVIRVGFDSGPVVGSVVGTSNKKYTIFGNTVNTASRMESTGVPGCIQCTDRAADLVRSQSFAAGGQAKLTERGSVEIKGKGSMRTFFVQHVTAPALLCAPTEADDDDGEPHGAGQS